MTSIRQLLIRPNDMLPGIQRGLRRDEAAEYLLSKAYARILGDDLPRREVLLKLAATMAFASVPLFKARAVPVLVPAIISGLVCGAASLPVFRKTFGYFFAENEEDKQLRGYVLIETIDQNSDAVEGSIMARYSFPANTKVRITFTGGPAATTKGDKLLRCSGEDSNDDAEFEAT